MTSLDPLFTVGSQIVEAIRAHRASPRARPGARAGEMLERVGSPSARRRSRATRTSFRRHAAAGDDRDGACLQPELLIADEPTTALDVTVQAQILELIDELQAELHMAVLLITHDLAVVRGVADRVAVMYAGEIVESRRQRELFERPRHPYTQGLIRSVPTGVGSRTCT